MKVTTWNNGSFNKSGAGYGVRISNADRDIYFKKSWKSVIVHIEDFSVEIKLRDTFWTTCSELRSKKIGEYLIKHGYAEWSKGKPFNLEMEVLSEAHLRLNTY